MQYRIREESDEIKAVTKRIIFVYRVAGIGMHVHPHTKGRDFHGKKFREFGSNSENKIPFLTPGHVDSRKLIPAKSFKINNSRKLIPAKFSTVDEPRIFEFLSDTMSFELGLPETIAYSVIY